MAQLVLNNEPSSEKITLFADLLLPVPIPNLFTYRVPFNLSDALQKGSRVIVQFGQKKILTGVVVEIHQKPPKHYEAKYILEILDEQPTFTSLQLKLLFWMADYYMCTPGEVLNVAIPAGLKLSSQSKIQLHPEYDLSNEVSFNESLIIEALQKNKSISFQEAANILAKRNIYPVLKSLISRSAIVLYEEVKEKYSPKIIQKVRLTEKYVLEKEALNQLFAELEKKPKQIDAILKYLQAVPVYNNLAKNTDGLDKKALLTSGISESALVSLIKKQVFEAFSHTVSRFETNNTAAEDIKLSVEQEEAYAEIFSQFEQKDTVLLHGITGSGKTQIYLQMIKSVLESGSQVLYLLPEIALTTQIVSRLKKFFGDQMGVYHSKFSDNERVEIWKGLLEGKFSFIVGVRSSVFLPFDNLGLIIIDEEHETSFKQYDPAPRYHARDVALMLARIHKSKTILGSATPSIESYAMAETGKYGLVTLEKRFGSATLPHTLFANTRVEKKKRLMRGEFSSILSEQIENALERQEQVIIFQNRRGYAPYLTCEDCAWIPKCLNCAVSLTYHLSNNELRCHYCGYKQRVPPACPACGSSQVKTVNYGTEKLEEYIKITFPTARVSRMDLDTTRKKFSYQKILEDFESGSVDILVGTQMVSKGLDFNKVSLVGIFDADRMIHFPDFRSYERTFQMITQVSGRAGRRDKQGIVVVQTGNEHQPVLQRIAANDYKGMYQEEMAERQKYGYPPFVRLIKLIVKSLKKELAEEAAYHLSGKLKGNLANIKILGPEEPLISRIRNFYIFDVMVKIKRSNSEELREIKKNITSTIAETLSDRKYKNHVMIVPDVDPN